MAYGQTASSEQVERMADQAALVSHRTKHRFAVRAKTASGRTTVYEVVKLHAIGIRRYIKIKADANPYLQEYARYFWLRRNNKDSKLLAAMSAREFRAMNAA